MTPPCSTCRARPAEPECIDCEECLARASALQQAAARERREAALDRAALIVDESHEAGLDPVLALRVAGDSVADRWLGYELHDAARALEAARPARSSRRVRRTGPTTRVLELRRDGGLLVVLQELRAVGGGEVWCLVRVLPCQPDRPAYWPA